jgi:hypothetical protein
MYYTLLAARVFCLQHRTNEAVNTATNTAQEAKRVADLKVIVDI